MSPEGMQLSSMIAAWFSALAACLSGLSAYFNYRLAKDTRDLARVDERLMAGVPANPDLQERDHRECVLWFPVFNKSSRKATVHQVRVKGEDGKAIDIDWSDEIDRLGTILHEGRLVGVIDEASLFIRRRDGKEFRRVTIQVSHSHPGSPLLLVFDPLRWMHESEGA
jgi:hypothetical protein